MTSNANTNVSLPNLSFSTTNVVGAIIDYSVFRNTTGSGAVTETQTGSIVINYNATNPTGNLWEISDEHVGIANTTFSITDVGQVQFSTIAITGTGYNGFVTYQAKAILQS